MYGKKYLEYGYKEYAYNKCEIPGLKICSFNRDDVKKLSGMKEEKSFSLLVHSAKIGK
jgi:hypothetical protein